MTENCKMKDMANWRTPNEWWFVAICQKCGLVVTSIESGGDAIKKLSTLHRERNGS